MLKPQFILPIADELVVDLFAGGGGASTGIEAALGRHVDIAINHDPEAVALHEANHPQTRHYVSDVFEVDPLAVCGDQPVGLLWASPDCKHFSKAKGGKPVSQKIRGLAWIVVEWIKRLKPTGQHPRVIHLENVEEFQTWGPLGEDDRPCPIRKGETFREWVGTLRAEGYVVEWHELRACDFGAPTIRKRLFLIARRDGQPIVWPAPTHGPGLRPYRTAADCIDWSIPAPSIFERERPLAAATLRRIAHGVMRYVINATEPYVVRIGHTGHGDDGKVRSARDPLSTITSKAEHCLVTPSLVVNTTGHPGSPADVPLRTITTGGHHALVSAFLAKHYTGVVGSELTDPVGTVTSVDHHSLVAANLVHLGHGEGADGKARFSYGIRDVGAPLNTVTASGAPAGVVTSHLVKLRGTSNSAPTDAPLGTVSAQGTHHAEVRAFLTAYYGSDQDTPVIDPLHTVTTKPRFGLVTVHGQQYEIADIGMRMLQPRELYRAQGFPENYIIDRGARGIVLSKAAQVRMCGNSVCPPLAAAIVAANYGDQHALAAAA